MMILRKSIYRLLCLLAGVCTLSGCIEEYEADIPSEDSDMLVVEGTISSGKWNRFYLTYSQPLNANTKPLLVLQATVSVRGSDGSEYKALPIGDSYSCWIDSLAPDVEYYLYIEAEGEVYESDPQKPLPTEQITEVRGVQNTPESSIDVLVTPDAPFEPGHANYYSWTCDATWEVHPEYTTDMYFDTEHLTRVFEDGLFPERGWIDAQNTTIMVGASTNYEGQHIKNLKLYDIGRNSEYVYYRYSGLVHQRAITKAEYEYELARRQAGSEMGGLFTPLPSALPTNIHCLTSNRRVIGFVGCSLNTSDYRFFLNAMDYSIYRPQRRDTRRWFDDTSIADCLDMVGKGMFLCVWEDDRMVGGKLTTAWANQYQLDVRLQGAYVEQPDFW